jgi:hypothetical protein
MMGIFICLMISFSLVLFPSIHDSFRNSFINPVNYDQFVRQSSKWHVIRTYARIAQLLALLLFLIRALLFRVTSSLRLTWNDERARMNRLRTFRPAFFVVLFIEIITLCLMFIFGGQYYLIGGEFLAVTGGIMTLAGIALYNDREIKDE